MRRGVERDVWKGRGGAGVRCPDADPGKTGLVWRTEETWSEGEMDEEGGKEVEDVKEGRKVKPSPLAAGG